MEFLNTAANTPRRGVGSDIRVSHPRTLEENFRQKVQEMKGSPAGSFTHRSSKRTARWTEYEDRGVTWAGVCRTSKTLVLSATSEAVGLFKYFSFYLKKKNPSCVYGMYAGLCM